MKGRIVKLFDALVWAQFFFLNPANVTKFQVEPPQRGRYTGGILQIETLVSETVRDRPIVKYYGTLIGSHR